MKGTKRLKKAYVVHTKSSSIHRLPRIHMLKTTSIKRKTRIRPYKKKREGKKRIKGRTSTGGCGRRPSPWRSCTCTGCPLWSGHCTACEIGCWWSSWSFLPEKIAVCLKEASPESSGDPSWQGCQCPHWHGARVMEMHWGSMSRVAGRWTLCCVWTRTSGVRGGRRRSCAPSWVLRGMARFGRGLEWNYDSPAPNANAVADHRGCWEQVPPRQVEAQQSGSLPRHQPAALSNLVRVAVSCRRKAW